jgi:hypothetical protein
VNLFEERRVTKRINLANNNKGRPGAHGELVSLARDNREKQYFSFLRVER